MIESMMQSVNRQFLLRTLRSILRTTLLSIRHAYGIKGTSDDVIAHTRQVLHTATTYEHNGVLLEIVADTRDVCRDFHPVRQPDTRDLRSAEFGFFGVEV